VIKAADHIIDLGPLGGDRGGELIAQGTPEEVAQCEKSFTGQYLRPILAAAGTISSEGAVTPPPVRLTRRRKTAATAAPDIVVPSANGARPDGQIEAPADPGELATTNPEQAAALAISHIADRLQREAAREERGPTKAAEKRARQAAKPRKETASERNLRETRERRKAGKE
ncbi:MAG: hypothetical protein ACM3S1_05960, partial [Hyphomicrobiales bacterium]